MTDRPLYKPGETVGFCVFLRSREGGPSTPISGRAAKGARHRPERQGARQPVGHHQRLRHRAVHARCSRRTSPSVSATSKSPPTAKEPRRATPFRRVLKPPEYVVSVEAIGNPKPGESSEVREGRLLLARRGRERPGRAIVTVTPWQHTFAAGRRPGRERSSNQYGGGWTTRNILPRSRPLQPVLRLGSAPVAPCSSRLAPTAPPRSRCPRWIRSNTGGRTNYRVRRSLTPAPRDPGHRLGEARAARTPPT